MAAIYKVPRFLKKITKISETNNKIFQKILDRKKYYNQCDI